MLYNFKILNTTQNSILARVKNTGTKSDLLDPNPKKLLKECQEIPRNMCNICLNHITVAIFIIGFDEIAFAKEKVSLPIFWPLCNL